MQCEKATPTGPITVLLGVPKDKERQWATTMVLLINTASPMGSHFILIAEWIRLHTKQKEKDKNKLKNKGGKEGLKQMQSDGEEFVKKGKMNDCKNLYEKECRATLTSMDDRSVKPSMNDQNVV